MGEDSVARKNTGEGRAMPSIIFRTVIAFLIGTLLSASALAATAVQIEDARAKGLLWLMNNQNGDGRWKSGGGLEVQATAAALEALSNAGVRKGYSYGAGVAWLKNADAVSTDALARKIAALVLTGVNEKPDLDLLLSWMNRSATWGTFDRYSTSFPDTPLALGAFRLGQYTYASLNDNLISAVYCNILPAQRVEGSWGYLMQVNPSLTPSLTAGILLPTAYVLYELQKIKDSHPTWTTNPNAINNGCGSSFDLSTGINKGVTWLLNNKRNLTDNGFGDIAGQSTVLDTALAYQVLTAVNSNDPAKDLALDYLWRQRAMDGSWQGDAFITGLVLKSFPATVMADINNDGIPDKVAELMTYPPRNLAKGNGQSVVGTTVPILISSQAYLNLYFDFPLWALVGVIAPGTITSGSLPPGLSLSGTTGASISITGIPTALGNFNFTYTAVDTAGATTTIIGQIDVLKYSVAIPVDGDLNGDGIVDVADVLLAERIALGLVAPSVSQQTHGDVAPPGAPNGVINGADVIRIRRKALGLETF